MSRVHDVVIVRVIGLRWCMRHKNWKLGGSGTLCHIRYHILYQVSFNLASNQRGETYSGQHKQSRDTLLLSCADEYKESAATKENDNNGVNVFKNEPKLGEWQSTTSDVAHSPWCEGGDRDRLQA